MPPLTLGGSLLAMSKDAAAVVECIVEGDTSYNLNDAEFEAWCSENEAAEWEQECSAMRRAEQNFGY